MNNSKTHINLSNAFAGESQAFQKYMFFADVCKKLGADDISKLFRETAMQETQHAASHFSLLHPELVITDPSILSESQKQKIITQCLQMAIDGETYEYTQMYPEMLSDAKSEKDQASQELIVEQIDESKEHANTFSEASRRFGYLVSIENYHADRYQKVLDEMLQQKNEGKLDLSGIEDKWICKKCSLIYDPKEGDPDGGIPAGTRFQDIPEDWICPICGATKNTFIPLVEALSK
jgi:rubrerythrin